MRALAINRPSVFSCFTLVSPRPFTHFSHISLYSGELGCLCGKAGTSHLCDGSAHSSGCVVNGPNAMAAF